jgi:small subunit ribosomal protein S16
LSVRIRLKRAGSRHRPFYKIVVADSRNARDGRAIEALGHYDPVKKPEVIEVNEERLGHWLSKGASMSESVDALVRRKRRRAERGDAIEAEEPIAPEPSTEAAAVPETATVPEAATAPEAGDAEKSVEASGAEAPEGEAAEAGEPEAGKTDAVPEGETNKE